ncbi:MAG: hypothetical protein ABI647_01270 [Gemmatimonadota bacterium]
MLDETTNRRLTGLTGAGYFVAFLLVALSLFDFALTLWPFQPSDPSWRYGSMGLLSGFLLTPMLGSLLATFIAGFAGHNRTFKTLGILNAIGALILLILLISFALDSIQVRRETSPEAREVFVTGAAKAAMKHLTGIIAFGWLGIATLRAGRRPRVSERADARSPILGHK